MATLPAMRLEVSGNADGTATFRLSLSTQQGPGSLVALWKLTEAQTDTLITNLDAADGVFVVYDFPEQDAGADLGVAGFYNTQ